jgi:hypothetical protein
MVVRRRTTNVLQSVERRERDLTSEVNLHSSTRYAGAAPASERWTNIMPLLMKEGLDADVFRNYRPISNLHTISKIVERVYMMRLAVHVKQSSHYDFRVNQTQNTVR